MSTSAYLISKAKQMGFRNVKGKGDGVLEKHIRKHGQAIRLDLLTSARDATMIVHIPTGAPFKFQFKRNYAEAARFIKDYLSGADDEHES